MKTKKDIKRSTPFKRWAVLPSCARCPSLYRHFVDFALPVETFRTQREARKAAKKSDMEKPVVRKVEMRIIGVK